jgi:hypothetical protein
VNERKTTADDRRVSGEPISGQTMDSVMTSDGAMAKVLGAAVIDAWAELPREVQEMLFERAVANGHGDALRHDLALFLHERHPRTAEH